ncbi:MAG TPA: 16S rRNA (guanine(966)-N(2))-methyltransferase RsmD [Bacteroidales bacterium]|nr:16S rRNA (guanine(966)-N(2))-methyltransferase RsmD [Bacteroidales bacterium]
MRIIAGKFQRKILRPPGNLPVRPTTDLAKESLFNILNNHFDFEELRVLDLFSGTGSISYEFISRGAQKVLAVENNFRCAEYIQKTATILETPQLKVVRGDVFRFLSNVKERFNLIFADPPFDMKGKEQIPIVVFEREILEPGGWMILEHPANENYKLFPYFREERKYGRVHFSIFERT